MKIGIFTDTHYCDDEIKCYIRRPKLSLKKVEQAMEYFKSVEVDMCICLGDLTDCATDDFSGSDSLYEVISVIKKYNIPFYCIPGNHDYIDYSADTFFEKVGTLMPPYCIDTPDYKLIMLDANYREDYRRFDVAGVIWNDSNLPPKQVDFLKKTLETADKKCIIFIHENLDCNIDEQHVIKNADEIRNIIEKSNKVKLVVQGHFHSGAYNVINDIRYFTLPAMCDGERNCFAILELTDEGESIVMISK